VRNLCKLKSLKGKTVDELLAHACISPKSLPLDLDKLLRTWKIIARSADMSGLEEIAKDEVEKNGAILGVVAAPNENVVLLFSDKSSKPRARFTIAHELAHCCLHTEKLEKGYIYFRLGGGMQPQEENEADEFARNLLMPEDVIISQFNEIKLNNPDIKNENIIHKLAITCDVAEEEVATRLRLLQLLD